MHAMCHDPGCQATPGVSNAFNSVNRQAALHNIFRLCPPLTQIFISLLLNFFIIFLAMVTNDDCDLSNVIILQHQPNVIIIDNLMV